jgi:hypothetical protein
LLSLLLAISLSQPKRRGRGPERRKGKERKDMSSPNNRETERRGRILGGGTRVSFLHGKHLSALYSYSSQNFTNEHMRLCKIRKVSSNVPLSALKLHKNTF